MKNLTSAIFAVTAVIGIAASASVSATSITSVLPKVVSNHQSTVTHSQVEFGPITIQDYLDRARSESIAATKVGDKSISTVKRVKTIEDILGSPVKL